MNNENKKIIARKRRGEISKEDIKPFKDLSISEIIEMLKDENPQNRTIAANILKIRNNKLAIEPLAKQFPKEKAIYTRIAISDSLASFGELAIPYLIQLLGKIGNNQEKELPKKYFNKKSFPLSRDLASRTSSKMGKLPTPSLTDVLEDNYFIEKQKTLSSESKNKNICFSIFEKEQAIDAIENIAYKYDDIRALDSLIKLLNFYSLNNDNNKDFTSDSTIGFRRDFNNDLIIQWKIIRALSGFKSSEKALNSIIQYLENCQKVEIQWETIRSIGQIGLINEEVANSLNLFENSSNSQIIKAMNVIKSLLY